MPTLAARTPYLGINTADIFSVGDAGYNQIPVGTIVLGANGRRYAFVQASGAIATGDTTPVPVIVTENAAAPYLTAATGAGAWSYRGLPAITSTQRLWVEANAI